MKSIKEQIIDSKEVKWEKEKELLLRQQKLDEEKKELKNKNKVPTSKKLITFLFINCTCIEIFTCWSIIQMLDAVKYADAMIDFTPLVTLIGTVVGEVIAYAVYSAKAVKENTKGGIVYDSQLPLSDPLTFYNNENINLKGE